MRSDFEAQQTRVYTSPLYNTHRSGFGNVKNLENNKEEKKMGQYSYSQPSSSSAASEPSEHAEQNTGLHTRCMCGGLLKVEVKPSGEEQGRLFFKCCFHESRGVHENRAWDVAATEEMAKLKKMILQLEERLDFSVEHRMNKIEDKTAQLKDKFNKTMEELYFCKRPLAGRLRLFGGAVRRKTRAVQKNWLVMFLTVCLMLSLAYNYLSVKNT